MPRMPQKILAEKGIEQGMKENKLSNYQPLTKEIGKWFSHILPLSI